MKRADRRQVQVPGGLVNQSRKFEFPFEYKGGATGFIGESRICIPLQVFFRRLFFF